MNADLQQFFRSELASRRERLQGAGVSAEAGVLTHLLAEVDLALERLESGEYGLCETCHDPVEQDRLLANPLTRFCLDHLTEREQRALEQDLEMAARIQSGLLPRLDQQFHPWDVHYSFEPARVVSGDYCDLIPEQSGSLLFFLGDVSGKGIAASMLMSHLHGMFRSLASLSLPLPVIMERAGRMFCDSTLPSHFATLISGRAAPDGSIVVCNAGHLPALALRKDQIESFGSRSLPLGLFCEGTFEAESLSLGVGENLVLFTDGVTEAQNASGVEFGETELSEVLTEHNGCPAREVVDACRRRLRTFLGGGFASDDQTILVLRYAP
jgi:phosphoserine phosphatase RsbU/P